jgi:hypothetical protein
MKAIVNLSREEMLKARFNQPRVTLEQLRQQMEDHRQASEEFFKAARNGILNSGQKKTAVGSRPMKSLQACSKHWFNHLAIADSCQFRLANS